MPLYKAGNWVKSWLPAFFLIPDSLLNKFFVDTFITFQHNFLTFKTPLN